MYNYDKSVALVLLTASFVTIACGLESLTYVPNNCERASVSQTTYHFEENIVNYNTHSKNGCPLSKPPSPDCVNWRIVSFIMLENSTFLISRTRQITDFIQTVTKNCGSDSEMQVFMPTTNGCPIYSIGSPEEDHLFHEIQPQDAISDPDDPGMEMFTLLSNMSQCLMDAPLLTNQAGVMFIFTDIDCNKLCNSDQLYNFLNDDNSIIRQVIQQNYVMRIMYFTNNIEMSGEKSCLTSLFDDCNWFPGSSCSLGVYDDKNNTLASATSTMMTCPMKDPVAPPPKGLNTTEIVLVIVIPCGCLVLISAFCVGIMYFRYKIQFKEKMEKWKSQRKEYDVKAGIEKMDGLYVTMRAMASRKQEKWEVPLNEINIEENEVLGKGAFATVYKATMKGRIPLLEVNSPLNLVIESNQDGQCQAAVKRLPMHADDQSRQDFFNEIEFMQNLGYHAHIVSMLGCVSNQWDPLIILEYCHYGDLLRFMRANRENVIETWEDVCPIDVDVVLRIRDLVSFAWQISDGMTYLSSKNFVHRDLAARNILMTKNLVAKIGDFGLCRQVDEALYTTKGGRLPIKWMALESLKFYEYTAKSDLWSFAVLLFEIFSLGDAPFSVIQPTEMIEHLEQGNRLKQPTQCPNEIFALMESCWHSNPEERPCFYKVRETLTILLSSDSEHYGYLDLVKPGNIRSMIMEEVSKADRTASCATDDMSIVDEIEAEPQFALERRISYPMEQSSSIEPEDIDLEEIDDEYRSRESIVLQSTISIDDDEIPSTSGTQEKHQECKCHGHPKLELGTIEHTGEDCEYRCTCSMQRNYLRRDFSIEEDCFDNILERDCDDRLVLRSPSRCNPSLFVFDEVNARARIHRGDSERRIEQWAARQMTMGTTPR